jgi:hypothetical protein
MTGPEHYRKAEELAKLAARYPESSDAPVLAQLATTHATLALTAATVEQAANAAIAADINSLTFDQWYPLTHRPTPEKDTREGESTPAEITIYRASHDSIVMGRYTTAAAARAHCEAEERRSWPKGTNLAFDWIEDEEDGVAELTVLAGQNEESATGYVVTPLTVASAYDEEADE